MRQYLPFIFALLLGLLGLGAPAAESLTLEQAYDRALATDQSIRTAYWEVKKANLLPWSAVTRLTPQINGGVGYQRSSRSTSAAAASSSTQIVDTAAGLTSAGLADSGRTVRTTRNDAGAATTDLTLTQPLIDLTFFPAHRLGLLSAQSARLAHQFTVREALYGVLTAYYEVLKQQRLAEVNQQTLSLSNEQLNLSQKRADVGEVTRSDVLRAQVVVETARRTLIESQNVLALDLNTLRNILNLAPDRELTLIEPPDYPTALPSFETLHQRAERQREDLMVKDLAVSEEIERKNEIVAEYAPAVAATATAGTANNSGSSRNRQEDWSAGVAVSVPFFSGGTREIALINAKYQIHEAELDRETSAKTVEADVKQGWLTVHTLEETLRALRIQVVAAEQSYHDIQNQYRAGTSTSVDVLSALNDLNTSQKDLAVQTYDYQVALRNLERVSGVFQEKRVQRVKIP